jgi:hypothetical protein
MTFLSNIRHSWMHLGLLAIVPGLAWSQSATATFVKADLTTQGNWISTYGSDGYNVHADQARWPSYVTPVFSGQSSYVWAASTTDKRALQKASNPAGRIAATWYTLSSFTMDLNFSDTAVHQVALYCLDFDSTARRQTVTVVDANGNVLSTQSLTSSFNGGVYLVWNVSGHVKFQISWQSGYNAVVSGLFFEPPTAPSVPPPSTATASACDLNQDGTINIADVQLIINMDLGLSPCTANVAGAGVCTVAVVQEVINAAMSGTCPVSVASTHDVAVSWGPSTSINVAGYNIYRGTASGGPYNKLNSSLLGTAYTDSAVQSGQTYYYVATAVDSSNNESAYSSAAQAVVPSP